MMNAFLLTTTIPIANVSYICYFSFTLTNVIFIACGCNAQGVEKGDLTCDKEGKCNCRCDVRGAKCSECEIGHTGFPNCTGK